MIGPHDDALPVTVLLPDTVSLPITLYDGGAALRMAIVERAGVQALTPDWDRPGVYVLLDRHESDGTRVAKRAAACVKTVNTSGEVQDTLDYLLASEAVIKDATNWTSPKAAAQAFR